MVKRATKDNFFYDELFTKELIEKSCTACRLFGSPWLASRVHFQDAFLTNSQDLPRLTEVRDGVGIDRDLGSAKRRIKFDFETVGDLAAFLDVDDYGPFEEFGIKKFLTRRLKTLSKGELRRVLIAIAMAKGKDLLILDEPYNGLDPDGRRVLRNVLRGIDSYIFVTHLIEEIPQNANRLIFIEKGKIVIDAKKGVRVYAHEGPNPPARAYALGRNIWIAKENIGKLIF